MGRIRGCCFQSNTWSKIYTSYICIRNHENVRSSVPSIRTQVNDENAQQFLKLLGDIISFGGGKIISVFNLISWNHNILESFRLEETSKII